MRSTILILLIVFFFETSSIYSDNYIVTSSASNIGYNAAQRGYTLYKQKKYHKALRAFEQALKKGYKKVLVYRQAIYTCFHLKKWAKLKKISQYTIKLLQVKIKKTRPFTVNISYRSILANTLGFLAHAYFMRDQYSKSIQTADQGYLVFPKYRGMLLAAAKCYSLVWLAHIAFGKKQYTHAVKLYNKAVLALSKSEKHPKGHAYFYRIRQLARLANRLKNISRIKTKYVHRVLGLFIRKTDVAFTGPKMGFIKGKRIMTQRQWRLQIILQKVLSRWVEAASHGRFSISFVNLSLNTTLKKINAYMTPGYSTERHKPVIESLTPFPGNTLYKNRNKYDTYIFYWNGADGISTSAHGGISFLPFVPYQLYSKKRGRLILPSNNCNNPLFGLLALLHEFFHTVECMADIKPGHGFYPRFRHRFPDWKGKYEFEYYLWHFEKTLLRVKLKGKRNRHLSWSNLNFRILHPDKTTSSIFLRNRNLVKRLNKKNLQNAFKLYKKAIRFIFKRKKAAGRKFLRKAYLLNPFHPKILTRLAILNGLKKEALPYYRKLSQYYPTAWGLKNLGMILDWRYKKHTAACSVYKRALRLFPASKYYARICLHYGRALLRKKQYGRALNIFKQGRVFAHKNKLKKDWSYNTFWIGYIYGKKQHLYRKAKMFIQQAVDSGYNTRFTRFYLQKFQKK